MNPRPLRVLHVVPSYLPAERYGGPVFAVHGLCKHLVRRGHQVDVFTTNVDGQGIHGPGAGYVNTMDGVKVNYFPVSYPRRLYYSPLLARSLRARIGSYDLLHLHSLFLYPTLAAARIAAANDVPYLLAPRGMLIRDLIHRRRRVLKLSWIHCFERRSLEQAAAIQATSRLEAQELGQFAFAWPQILVLPNGLEAPPLDPAMTRDPRLILSLGRLNWKKGLDRLIPAMAQLPECRLLIAGDDEDGYARVLQELVSRHGLEQRVKFCGPVRGGKKWRLFQQAGVFVLPSHSENFANTVLEAMAMACPVVVTPQVGLAQVVAATAAGIVSESRNADLVRAISEILGDSARALRMGEIGRQVVAEQFSWPAVAASVERAYWRLPEAGAHRSLNREPADA